MIKKEFYEKIPNSQIDTFFVDGNGERIPREIINKKLVLFEKNPIQEGVIFFHTLEEYLDDKNMFDKMKELSEEEIKKKKEFKSFLNGLLFKYWPDLYLSDILNYNTDESFSLRKIDYKKQKEIIDVYTRGQYIIESEFLNKSNKTDEDINCSKFTIDMLKINKSSSNNNTVHLAKLFTDFELDTEISFMKLLLNSHDDAFYKLYVNSLIYEGTEKTKERHINQKLCKTWSDGYNIQTEYGYRYLHSGNIILFKVYNNINEVYSTLIINMNGDIECIIESNTKGVEINQAEIILMIKDCNKLLRKINRDNFYSFKNFNH